MTSFIDSTNRDSLPKLDLITGLAEIEDQYDGFILDLFGVLHNGVTLYEGTLPALKALKAAGKPVVLLSNTPKRSYSSRNDLQAMGISADLYNDLITAGDGAFEALNNRDDEFHQSCGHACWFLGPEKMAHIMDGLELKSVDGPQDASFILNSMPGTDGETIENIEELLTQAIQKDLPMVCANPDLVVNIADKQYKCAGTFAKHYEDLGGRVVYHGKPYNRVYEMAQASLGVTHKSRIVAVGDSLHTDIQGACNFGIDGVFNLVGIHRDEVLMDNTDTIDLDKVSLVISNSPHQPMAVMEGLAW